MGPELIEETGGLEWFVRTSVRVQMSGGGSLDDCTDSPLQKSKRGSLPRGQSSAPATAPAPAPAVYPAVVGSDPAAGSEAEDGWPIGGWEDAATAVVRVVASPAPAQAQEPPTESPRGAEGNEEGVARKRRRAQNRESGAARGGPATPVASSRSQSQPFVSRCTRSRAAPDWSVANMLALIEQIAAVDTESWSKSLSSFQKWKIVTIALVAISLGVPPCPRHHCPRVDRGVARGASRGLEVGGASGRVNFWRE